jgi:hypothetical protein
VLTIGAIVDKRVEELYTVRSLTTVTVLLESCHEVRIIFVMFLNGFFPFF